MKIRRCPVCGNSLAGRRPQTRYCDAACRAEGSRLRRLLAGQEVDGYLSHRERMAAAQKRTGRAR